MLIIEKRDRLGKVLFENFLGGELKYRYLLQEETKENSKAHLANAVIRKVIASVKFRENKLDTKDIDASGGNFNKLRNKDYILNCIKYFETFNVDSQNKNITRYNLILNETVKILTTPSIIKNFERGYQEDISLIRFLYTSVCLNLMLAVSSIISFLVTYIKDSNGSYLIAFSKENNSDIKYVDLLIGNLEEFNKSSRSGTLFTFFKGTSEVEKTNTIHPAVSEDSEFDPKRREGVMLKESIMTTIGVVGGGIVIGVAAILLLINLIRFIIYLYYRTRMKISDSLEQQAYFLELNISTLDRKVNSGIIKKQEYQVKQLRKYADRFRGDMKDAVTKADNDIKKEEKYLQQSISKDDFQNSSVLI